MDTEATGFVRSSANDGPISPPRHDDGFAAQLRVVPLLDGGIERVHVHVDDLADAHLVFMICRYVRAMMRCERSERVCPITGCSLGTHHSNVLRQSEQRQSL